MKIFQVLSLITFLCLCSEAFAQPQTGGIDPLRTEPPGIAPTTTTADTTRSIKDPFRYYSLSVFDEPLIQDSSLFEPLDPVWYDKAIRYQTYLQQTGNFGAAIFDPLRQNRSPYLIRNGFNQYDRSMFRASENSIELPSKRFTNINYHLGSKREQHIYVQHNQRFRPWIVAGLKFGDPCAVDVESDGGVALAELDRQRQSHVSQSDDCNLGVVDVKHRITCPS